MPGPVRCRSPRWSPARRGCNAAGSRTWWLRSRSNAPARRSCPPRGHARVGSGHIPTASGCRRIRGGTIRPSARKVLLGRLGGADDDHRAIRRARRTSVVYSMSSPGKGPNRVGTRRFGIDSAPADLLRGHRHREDRPDTSGRPFLGSRGRRLTRRLHTTPLLILTHVDAVDPIPSAVQHTLPPPEQPLSPNGPDHSVTVAAQAAAMCVVCTSVRVEVHCVTVGEDEKVGSCAAAW